MVQRLTALPKRKWSGIALNAITWRATQVVEGIVHTHSNVGLSAYMVRGQQRWQNQLQKQLESTTR
jgi:hypothetical protein